MFIQMRRDNQHIISAAADQDPDALLADDIMAQEEESKHKYSNILSINRPIGTEMRFMGFAGNSSKAKTRFSG